MHTLIDAVMVAKQNKAYKARFASRHVNVLWCAENNLAAVYAAANVDTGFFLRMY